MRERVPVGLSMPKTFIIQIDSERGDIPRSRYIQKLIEVGIVGKQKEKGEGHGSQPVQPSLAAVTTLMEETTAEN